MDESDTQLVREYLQGNRETFASLVKRYLAPVYHFVWQFTRQEKEVCEDITQDTFIKVWKNIKRYNETKKFSTWIFQITKNTCLDYLKKKKPASFSQILAERGETALDSIQDPVPLPNEIFARKELSETVARVFAKLTAHQRAVLTLHYKESMTLAETADILEMPLPTVKSHHQRAIKKMRELLVET